MKRIAISLIFLLGVSECVFAQLEIKIGKFKLEDGNIYKGSYYKGYYMGSYYQRYKQTYSPFKSYKKNKIPHGNGIMYYSNGDTFDGDWEYGKPRKGTYTYNDGSEFIGSISLSSWNGSLTFKNDENIVIGFDSWLIKAGTRFSGEIKQFSKIIVEGEFSNEITTTRGDIFCGNIKDKELANGKYYYAQTTTLNNGWTIPSGCTFNGDIKSFSGTLDTEMINAAGDKYIGQLKNGKPEGTGELLTAAGDKYIGELKEGKPDGKGELLNASGDRYTGSFSEGLPHGQGTMVYTDGRTETGIWHHGQSPSEYEAQQKLYAEECLAKFDKYFKEEIEEKEGSVYFHLCSSYVTKDVQHGASLRLKQMFCGKKFIRLKDHIAVFESSKNKNKEEKIYECIDITDDKIILKSETGETIKRSIYYFSVDSKPNEKLSEYIPYPNKLKGVYQYYELYVYNPSDKNDKYSIYPLADRELSRKRTTDFFIKKYGYEDGVAVANKKTHLGMTIEMIEDMFGYGQKSSYLSGNRERVTITYGGGYDLVFGFRNSSTEYTFVNNKLTNIYSY